MGRLWDGPAIADLRYGIYQLERGAEGTEHWQGYLEFSVTKRLAALRRIHGLAGAHFERRRGTADEARNYCRKEDTRLAGPYEFGEYGKVCSSSV